MTPNQAPSPAWERLKEAAGLFLEHMTGKRPCDATCIVGPELREALSAVEAEMKEAPEVERVELTADDNTLPGDGRGWTIRVYAERPVPPKPKPSDLPGRLRTANNGPAYPNDPGFLIEEAATEIERLERELRGRGK